MCKREVANALWAVASDVYAFLVGSACDKVWMAAAESDFGVVDEFEMVYWIARTRVEEAKGVGEKCCLHEHQMHNLYF